MAALLNPYKRGLIELEVARSMIGFTPEQVVELFRLLGSIAAHSLTALISGGAAGAATLFFARNYFTTKIRASIQHHYDVELESWKDALKRESDSELEKLRRFNTEQMEVQKAAFGAFQASHGAAFERRLKAIDVLWGAFLNVSRNTPSVVALTDILLETEYADLLSKPRWRVLVDALSDNDFQKLADMTEAAESVRPFAKEQLYAILFTYRAIVGRMILSLTEGKKKGSILPWPRDPVVHLHMKVVFSDEEISAFRALRVAHYSWIRRMLEAKFLLEAQTIALGQESAETALQQSRKLRERVQLEIEQDQAQKAELDRGRSGSEIA
ncbi:MAG: hypothetical protein ABSD31_10365 [Candidatus Binataceae bacterium]